MNSAIQVCVVPQNLREGGRLLTREARAEAAGQWVIKRIRARFATISALLRLETQSGENSDPRGHALTIFGIRKSKPSWILGLSGQSRPKTLFSTAMAATPPRRGVT